MAAPARGEKQTHAKVEDRSPDPFHLSILHVGSGRPTLLVGEEALALLLGVLLDETARVDGVRMRERTPSVRLAWPGTGHMS